MRVAWHVDILLALVSAQVIDPPCSTAEPVEGVALPAAVADLPALLGWTAMVPSLLEEIQYLFALWGTTGPYCSREYDRSTE